MEKLWTTAEVARFLGIADIDVEQLVREGKLSGYQLGGQFLRFRPDQVQALKATMHFRRTNPKALAVTSGPWLQRLHDFVYFYDFYIVSAALLAVLLIYLVASG